MPLATSRKRLRRLVDAVEWLVDPRVGVVHHVEEVRREPGSPDFFHYAALACNTKAFSSQANFRTTGGASSDRELAVAKAVGEAVERYCAALYDLEAMPLASSATAPFDCVTVGDFALHSDEQYARPGFPWAPLTEDTPVRWAELVDLTSGKPAWVPAAMVYVPYHYYRGTGDTPIVQPISTGLACHCSATEAAVAALCEVIERDAFTITWLARLAPPQIRVETLSDANYDLVNRFERVGGRVVLLDITVDHGIPTVLAVLRCAALAAPALVFAAAASLDPERAVRGALEELAHTRRYSHQIKRRMPPVALDDEYRNVISQIEHLGVYASHDNVHLAEFILSSRDRRDFDELARPTVHTPADELAALRDRVNAVGHRVLVADLTTPDIAQVGLSVVRVVVPGFHPLFMGHEIRALGGTRLQRVPVTLGYQPQKAFEPNTAPHPYP